MGWFNQKTEKEKLQLRYEKLMKQAFELSKIDRKAGDAKYLEANQLLKKMETLTRSDGQK